MPAANTMHRFRMNWGAGGRRIETSDDHSIFVGDLAPDVTDELLFSTFSARFPSVRGAKARCCFTIFDRSKWTLRADRIILTGAFGSRS